ncbi:MAG: glycosyltransferase family 4 protein [Bacteroidetes bacterium]|nr:glycosyltransferase family 4 protein [Bacteroidota bacterium]
MKKLLYITNIPAPYRQKRFNLMQEIFPKYGIDFEVLYMAKIEPDRKWVIPEDSYQYNYKIFKGIHPVIGGFFAHFNPGLLFRLLKKDYDIAIVGGMSNPTLWLAPFFIRGKKIKVMSVESNLHSTARKSGFGAKLKKTLLNKADAYQTTGNPQIKYIQFFSEKAKSKKYVRLPNLIDEEVFRDKVAVLRIKKEELREIFKVSADDQMWVLPARLIEIKGIMPLLELLRGVNNIHLFILGDGELKETITEYCQNENIKLTLTGFIQQDKVIEYYAAADLFVLPSLKDSSPLSPIEACAAGLPLLVSSRIGNLEDVVAESINGWSYDPITETEKGRKLVESISQMTADELAVFGKNSAKRYVDAFESRRSVENYAKQLIDLLN